MQRDRAAYMREYRAERKRLRGALLRTAQLLDAQDRIVELEAEVRHLRAELAKRPAIIEPGFNTRPFTPVPKHPITRKG